ncbi:P-type conjugative transfer protein TrbG [Legionella anisa]|uniref:P-type conjugative transfer protein TrbG n=1 Tax=Legionella anisa TaxID=28082 RepID=A0AAX0WPF0_9GAMM|nr:P-type conjugative transfer protein TrbG [Legionella anisa]AWN73040.1 P-type conjugative transfer protein TrbG [Legionella anisa]KTC75643.1 conjugal transfer protein trbG precursor [Legionella anisa]MCW8423862.1 P-type conjugative transfer protein TrbG [Legionella anisa]MCW8447384.1 P-type conjugative transfer protein TrbG [Legionella anisa]PNL60159.1 P-type conjugative transfer protein TrbG [Legionella anisa]
MKKIILSLCLLLPLTSFDVDNTELANFYFSKNIPALTNQEKQALNIAEEWQKGDKTSKPFHSSDGSVSFVYGSGQTRVVCAPLQVCDIALQQGEQLNDMNVGDPRFLVEPSITGSGMDQQIHLLIKPKDVGLDTSLVVTTDRRTYHFRLKSDQNDFMPYVSFTYPDDAKAKWRLIQHMQAERRKANTFTETNEYLGDLNFNYRIQGNSRFKPVRIYNNGVKTIIEMPKAMSESEAPALLVLRNGGLFKKPESVMVNYRLQGCRYIVDSVFDKAILIIGSGSSQEKITITRC